MKLAGLFLAMVLLSATSLTAQKFVFVDTDYILNKIPEYKDAQTRLDEMAVVWKDEIDKKYKEIDNMYRKFQAEQYLLDEETKIRRENDIVAKEKEAKDFQQQKFGFEGELFKKRQELINPIQDKVYNAIAELAKNRGYDFIFDRASSEPYMLH